MTRRAKKSYGSKVSSPNSEALRDALRVVKEGRRFLIATHRNPDGDALGSAISLALGLRLLGKRITVYNADPVPYSLRFLPHSKMVTSRLGAEASFDATFVVDCSELGRVGDKFCSHLGLGRIVLLDHHARGKKDGDIRVVDVDAASSGVIVHRFLSRLGCQLTPQIATCLYVTLVTDTGNFRYANTTEEVLSLASSLVRLGAIPERIDRYLHQNDPRQKLSILAQVVDNIKFFNRGLVGVIVVTRSMIRKARATIEMTDDFVDYPRSLAGVEVAVLMRETLEGWRVSSRSKSKVDVGSVAVGFGGGGHIRAAGFTGKGSLISVRSALLSVLSSKL